MYMQRSLPFQTRDLPAGYSARPQTPDDVDALARLYLTPTRPASRYPISMRRRPRWQPFSRGVRRSVESASLVALDGDGELVGCVQTVERGVWEGSPECLFVIECSSISRNVGRASVRPCWGWRPGHAGGGRRSVGTERRSGGVTGAFRMYLAMGFQGS